MICSCSRLQCPTLPALFSFTHQRKICWKDPLCPRSTVLLEHPVHHRHAVFVWLLWGSPLGLSHVPVHMSQQLHQRNKGEQGKEKKMEEVYSLLFSPFHPPPLREAVEKEISYWLISHPGVKQLSVLQNTNGENHPSCTCLQGQSAPFVPWMLNTRFIKVMFLLQGSNGDEPETILPIRPHNRYIYSGNKGKNPNLLI